MRFIGNYRKENELHLRRLAEMFSLNLIAVPAKDVFKNDCEGLVGFCLEDSASFEAERNFYNAEFCLNRLCEEWRRKAGLEYIHSTDADLQFIYPEELKIEGDVKMWIEKYVKNPHAGIPWKGQELVFQ